MQKNSILTTNINASSIVKKDISSYTYFNYNKKRYISNNYIKKRKYILKK